MSCRSKHRIPLVGCVGVVGRALLVCACVFVFHASARADETADGRRHAKRASHLAASGKCKQAIVEYNKALTVIHDPALLFNRGECHRKVGDVDAALKDYNQFLADLPKAPNRVEVEARIAELRRVVGPRGAISGPGRTAVDTSPSGLGAKPGPPPPAPAVDTAPAVAVSPSRAPFRKNDPTGALPPAANPVPKQPDGTALTFSNRQTTPMSSDAGPTDDSLTNHAWFWVAIAAAAVGVGVGTYVVLSQEHTSIPASPLGNYRF